MKDLNRLKFNPTMEKLVDILSAKTQNADKMFFRVMVSYFFAKIASMMRCYVQVEGFGKIPVNMYAINLAVSGSGKGRSINAIEDQVIKGFRERFLEQTFPAIAELTIHKTGVKRANRNATDPEEESQKLKDEFESAGPLPFSFDSGTTAAVKQMRHKLLLAGAGSMNMEIDEIGSNLLGNQEVLNAFLELYDVGKIKQKLVKNTRENARTEELFGNTPANMLLFGTPTKLLNGSKVEDEFTEMLEAGYARRSFFGYSTHESMSTKYTASQIYDIFTDNAANNTLITLNDRFTALADMVNFESVIKMPKDVTIQLLEYRLHCEKRADGFSEFEEIRKAEMRHRYFKVMKLAGVYAFIDNAVNVTEEHLWEAVKLAEDSGQAFNKILRRERPWAKLASYICTIGREVTHADLTEDLPFYKGSESQKREMLNLAIAHGYKNNQIIKRETMDGIEFLSGTSLPRTNLKEIRLSYSNQITKGYSEKIGNWANIHKLCTADGMHWCNHHLVENPEYPGEGGYRSEEHVVPGFNIAVIDVDSGTDIDTVKMLLKEYRWFLHTTKRHTDQAPRFRLVMPLSHTIELDKKDYREFMNNLYNWLPFQVDTQTNERSRKWCSHPGSHFYNDGELLDALQFIPKTKKADEQKKRFIEQSSLTNLERWFVNSAEEGNRNQMLARYAFILVDMGKDFESIKNNVLALNTKLKEPLTESEVLSTVLASASKKLSK